jgi:hypothetical protein
MKTLLASAALLIIFPMVAPVQDADHPPRGEGYSFFGLGTGAGSGAHPVVEHTGFGGEGFIYRGLGLSGEVGYAWWQGQDNWTGTGSVDLIYRFRRSASSAGAEPFILGGLTGYAHHGVEAASNFGSGVNLWLNRHAALRWEVRDHVPGGGRTPGYYDHYVSFRVGMTFRSDRAGQCIRRECAKPDSGVCLNHRKA